MTDVSKFGNILKLGDKIWVEFCHLIQDFHPGLEFYSYRDKAIVGKGY